MNNINKAFLKLLKKVQQGLGGKAAKKKILPKSSRKVVNTSKKKRK